MTFINVVKREIERFYKRPLIWTISFFLPLIMSLIICLIFAKGSPTDLPIAILDNDNSEISRLFIRNLNALPSCNVKYRVSDFLEGKQLLTEGKAYAFFAIPKDFQSDMYKMKKPKLLFYYNNQRILIGGIISKDVNMMVQSMMVGLDAKIRTKQGLPYDEALKQANLIKIDDHIHSNPYFNYQYFLALVALGHTIQISMILLTLWAFGSEFKYGTTKQWLNSAENSIVCAIFGKIAPYFLIFSLFFALLYAVLFGAYSVPFAGNWILVIFSTIFFILACFAAGLLFLSFNGNFRFSLSNAAFYSAMGFAFAGVTFPTMSMPLVAKIYSAMLPLSYWIQIMIDQSQRQTPVIYDYKQFLGLTVFILIGLLAMPRIKSLAHDEKRWYQI